MSGLRLITFPPSQDSELARFMLDHYGIAYTEKRHTLIFSSLVSLVKARTILFPALYGDGPPLAGPLNIGMQFENRAPSELKLIPPQVDRKSLDADWAFFHGPLSSASRV